MRSSDGSPAVRKATNAGRPSALPLRETLSDPCPSLLSVLAFFGRRCVLLAHHRVDLDLDQHVGVHQRLTSTIVAAGRMSRKICPCARPTASQRAMSVTYMRVRTTSRKLAPASWSAFSMLRKHWTAWA